MKFADFNRVVRDAFIKRCKYRGIDVGLLETKHNKNARQYEAVGRWPTDDGGHQYVVSAFMRRGSLMFAGPWEVWVALEIEAMVDQYYFSTRTP